MIVALNWVRCVTLFSSNTHATTKILKTPLLPPGTKIGPMNLPLSYCTKDYRIARDGKTVKPKKRRLNSGASRYAKNKLLDGDPIL